MVQTASRSRRVFQPSCDQDSTPATSSPKVPFIVHDPKFVIQVSKGLIRDARARRLVMFYSIAIALVLCFAGSTFLGTTLREHPFIFIIYWGACAWLVLLAVLLSLYDLLKVRAELRKERRRLAREMVEDAEKGVRSHPRDEN
jgi:hypothetical protein